MEKLQRNVRSHSSVLGLGFLQKMRENFQLLWVRLRGTEGSERFDSLFNEFAEYDRGLAELCGTTLWAAKALEIGYGARPNRLIALMSLGVDAKGIDIDRPTLELTAAGLLEIYRRNGFERALKSAARGLVFDRSERRALADAIAKHGGRLNIDPTRFMVGDAAQLKLQDHSLDLIYSEDVFEHIPVDAVATLIANMQRWLKPTGLAMIRPNIFTGIMGSHLVEWYLHSPDSAMARATEPWEHLRKKRFHANCYLNQLWRRDYRAMFSRCFDIVEERVELPDMGRIHYSGSVRDELSEYGEDELFSNRVLFVLKPKPPN